MEIAHGMQEHVMEAKEPATVGKYMAAFRRWKKWTENFDEVEPLPAKPGHLSAYLMSLMNETRSYSSVETAYYALSWIHNIADLPNPTLHSLPKMLKESAKRKLMKAPQKKVPATPSLMAAIVNKYGKSESLSDLRLATMSILSYSGFLRFNDLINLKVSDLRFDVGHVSVYIAKSKTDVYNQGQTVVISETNNMTCPIKLTREYMKRGKLEASSERDKFLFRRIVGTGTNGKFSKVNQPIGYSRARSLLLNCIQDLGYDAKTLGSIRSGEAAQRKRPETA